MKIGTTQEIRKDRIGNPEQAKTVGKGLGKISVGSVFKQHFFFQAFGKEVIFFQDQDIEQFLK